MKSVEEEVTTWSLQNDFCACMYAAVPSSGGFSVPAIVVLIYVNVLPDKTNSNTAYTTIVHCTQSRLNLSLDHEKSLQRCGRATKLWLTRVIRSDHLHPSVYFPTVNRFGVMSCDRRENDKVWLVRVSKGRGYPHTLTPRMQTTSSLISDLF